MATRLSVRSFARTAHSFACSALLALLARSAVLMILLTRTLTLELVGMWIIRCCNIWLFWTLVSPRCIGNEIRFTGFRRCTSTFIPFCVARLRECAWVDWENASKRPLEVDKDGNERTWKGHQKHVRKCVKSRIEEEAEAEKYSKAADKVGHPLWARIEKTQYKYPSNHQLSHKRGSERTSERSTAREQSKQCRANECVSEWTHGWASGPVLQSIFLVIQAHSAIWAANRKGNWFPARSISSSVNEDFSSWICRVVCASGAFIHHFHVQS